MNEPSLDIGAVLAALGPAASAAPGGSAGGSAARAGSTVPAGLVAPGGLALVTIGERPVSLATSISAALVEQAARRRTPLLVVTSGPIAPEALVWRQRPWPIVAITDAPELARAADFGLLVGRPGPCDHGGLDEATAAELATRFIELADDSRRIDVESLGAGDSRRIDTESLRGGPPSAESTSIRCEAPAPDSPPTSDSAEAAPPGPGSTPGPGRRSLLDVVPFAIDAPYDVRAVLDALLDDGAWVSFDDATGPEVLTAIGRLGGRSVAIAASQPAVGQGVLSPAGLAKVERLVRLCCRGRRPLVTLVDTNGCAAPADIDELHALRQTASTVRSADVAKIAVVLGRAVGLGATVLGAVGARADAVLPWPRARFALGALDGSAEHDTAAAVRRAAREADVRDIIHPDDTRARLIELLEVLRGPREYAS